MATTYNWDFGVSSVIEFNGYANFVTLVIWTYIGTNDSGYTATITGQTTFDQVIDTPENPYIPYEELTIDEVSKWLDEANDIVALRKILDDDINNQMNI